MLAVQASMLLSLLCFVLFLFFLKPYFGFDVERLIRSKQPLSVPHLQYIVFQVLRGLKYLHSGGCVHRALRPHHVLINENCDVALAGIKVDYDPEDDRDEKIYFADVYVAPEVTLCLDQDSSLTPVRDIWSLGCIFAELLNGTCLFPGDSSPEVLRTIIQKLGVAEKDWDFVQHSHARAFLSKIKTTPPPSAIDLFPQHASQHQAMDFIFKALTFDPSKRMTAAEALSHPFLEQFHNSGISEPIANKSIGIKKCNPKSFEQVQEVAWNLIRSFHPISVVSLPVDSEQPLTIPSFTQLDSSIA